MTREKAVALANEEFQSKTMSECFVEACVKLGMLRLDDPPQPKTPMERLEDCLRRKYFNDNNIADLKLALMAAGLEIVDSKSAMHKSITETETRR